MRYQVVLSGFDSNGSATIKQDLHFPIVLPSRNSYGKTMQQDLHFPIILPSRNSYGKTIIGGLYNIFIPDGNMSRLYEHDDKLVGEMDNITLYDLSFVQIDD